MGKYNKKKKKDKSVKKPNIKERLDILEKNWGAMEKNIRYQFQIFQNYRMFRLKSNLTGIMIPSKIPNPTCKYLNLDTAVCGCEWCMHFKKTCFFSAYMKDCVHMRGINGEIPEIYEKHGVIPDDMKHIKKDPVKELIKDIKEDREKEKLEKLKENITKENNQGKGVITKSTTGEEEIKEYLESEKKKFELIKEEMSEVKTNRKLRYHDDPYHISNWCVICSGYYCWHDDCEEAVKRNIYRNDLITRGHKFKPMDEN